MNPNAAEALKKWREENKDKKVVRKNPLEKLAENPTSLRLAINARCYQCEGEDYDPGVRERIATCPQAHCGLWRVRPYQAKT